MKRKTIFTLMLAALLVGAACTRGPEIPGPFLRADLQEIEAPGFAVEYNVQILSNIGWRIASNEVYDWVTPSLTESRGSATLVLSVERNEGTGAREGVIALESDDNSVREEIRIAQRALSAEGFSRIREIRSLERAGGYTIIQGKVRGFVVTDAAASNYTENTFAVEDSFDEPSCGIAVRVAADRYAAPGRGTEVVIDLAGARLERTDGILTLSLQDNPPAGDATPLPVRPDTVTFADLATGNYESMFVCLKECQVVEDAIGGILASSPRITDESGDPLGRLVVSADSPFGSVVYGRGGGKVCGIAGAVRDGICEILPTSADDVAFTAKRIGEKPGILELPYVFSFYCSSQTDGACKYINYYKLYWDPVTLLTSGKIADDKDESIGAALYVSAFASEASKTYGPNMWAEAGAHDNINTVGFVSLGSKTTPTAECGWYLDVPLRMTLPDHFTVTFGMGGNTYTIRNWTIYYSSDNENWYEGGHYSLDHIVAGGSYYLFFSVPINCEIPFVAGDTLHLKFIPEGTTAIGGSNNADGHGSSCFIRFHSSIIIAEEKEGSTPAPSNAVWFEPFDHLTGGVDYFLGNKVGGLANFGGSQISDWSEEQLRGMGGHDVYERPGYAQIGFVDTERSGSRREYHNTVGALESPEMGVSGDLTLTFEAAAYRSPAIRPGAATTTPDVGSPDINTGVIEVLGGGLINGSESARILQMSTAGAFSTHTFTIEGATPQTRIRFTSAPAEGEFSRWFIDNITVTKR